MTLAGLFLSWRNCVGAAAGTDSPAVADADADSETEPLELLIVDAGIDYAGAGVCWVLERDNGDGLLRHDLRSWTMQFYRVIFFFNSVSSAIC